MARGEEVLNCDGMACLYIDSIDPGDTGLSHYVRQYVCFREGHVKQG